MRFHCINYFDVNIWFYFHNRTFLLLIANLRLRLNLIFASLMNSRRKQPDRPRCKKPSPRHQGLRLAGHRRWTKLRHLGPSRYAEPPPSPPPSFVDIILRLSTWSSSSSSFSEVQSTMRCINVLVGRAVQSCTVRWVENFMWANVQCQFKNQCS